MLNLSHKQADQKGREAARESLETQEGGRSGVRGGRIYAVPGRTLWGRDSTGGKEMDVRAQKNSAERWPKVVIILLNCNGWREGGPKGNLEGDLR